MSRLAFALFDTPIGACAAAWSDVGLMGVQLPEADEAATCRRLLARVPGAIEQKPRGPARRAIEAIRAHLGGELSPLTEVPFDDGHLPAFHRRVYDALRRVRPGETVGYGELAALAGSPGAARAVGQAVGKNPLPIVVPCHRVLASGGKPGGFSAHGGVETKRRILAIEGVHLGPANGARRRKGLACDLDEALAHLRQKDPKLAAVIDRAAAPELLLDRTESTFQALAQSIVYQQLSGKAAATIFGRVRDLFPRRKLTPEGLRDATDEALRGAGLSRGKTRALRDLSARALAGTVPDIDRLHVMSDEAIVDRLVQVRGIGRWTVQMLLIFRLGRADVLPIDDYGVRAGFQKAYGKRKLPTPKELARHGERWKPFRTIGAWYMWRALELSRGQKSDGRG